MNGTVQSSYPQPSAVCREPDEPLLMQSIKAINESLDQLGDRIAKFGSRLSPLSMGAAPETQVEPPQPLRDDTPVFAMLADTNRRVVSMSRVLREINDTTVI